MGDRISISFVNTGFDGKDEESVTLFHHWGGKEFGIMALDYTRELIDETKAQPDRISTPLSRLEPGIVMVDFIRYCFRDGMWLENGRAKYSIYLGKDQNDGDNSDNGHWCIDLRTGDLKS